MKNFKKFGSIFLFAVSCFTLGIYACSTIKCNNPVELYRWTLTILSGLLFLGFFLYDNEKYKTK